MELFPVSSTALVDAADNDAQNYDQYEAGASAHYYTCSSYSVLHTSRGELSPRREDDSSVSPSATSRELTYQFGVYMRGLGLRLVAVGSLGT